MRPIMFSIAAGLLTTVLSLFVADRLTTFCTDYRSVPVCPQEQR